MSKVPVTSNSSALSSNTSLVPKMGAWECRHVHFLSLDAFFFRGRAVFLFSFERKLYLFVTLVGIVNARFFGLVLSLIFPRFSYSIMQLKE